MMVTRDLRGSQDTDYMITTLQGMMLCRMVVKLLIQKFVVQVSFIHHYFPHKKTLITL